MPAALQRLVAWYGENGWERLKSWREQALSKRRVHFIGMGTSEFVGGFVQQSLAKAGVDATCHDAGEILQFPRPVCGLQVYVSQSGESVETRRLVELHDAATKSGCIVNNEASSLATQTNWSLPMCAGDESAISTKTYLNTLAVLYLMEHALDGRFRFVEALNELEQLAQRLESSHESLSNSEELRAAAALIADRESIHFIARGPAMVAAHQSALTFMEGTRLTARAFTGGAFRHGPFEVVDETHRCVVFLSSGSGSALLTAMTREMGEKGSHVVVLADSAITVTSSQVTVLRVPNVGEALFPLVASVAQSLLLEAVASARGYVAGDFRHSSKITSRE